MGPGRSGTTFIWTLLRELGYTTEPEGYPDRAMFEIMRYPDVMARLDKGEIEWPQVIKHLGGFCHNLNSHIDKYDWKIKHIFFCLRKLDRSIELRFEKEIVGHKMLEISKLEFNSLNLEAKKLRMKDILLQETGAGLYNLIERDHPFTVVRFPKSILDMQYCYDLLAPVCDLGPSFEEKWSAANGKWGEGTRDDHYEEEDTG